MQGNENPPNNISMGERDDDEEDDEYEIHNHLLFGRFLLSTDGTTERIPFDR